MSTFGTNWLDLSSTSNRHIRTYVQGFVDISGGNLIVRTGDASFNANVVVGNVLYPNGGINLQNNLTMGGLINQSATNMSGGLTYQPLLATDVSAMLTTATNLYTNLNANGNVITLGNVNTTSIILNSSGGVIPITVSGPLYGKYDVSLNSRLFVVGDSSLNSRFFVGGDVSLNSRLFVSSDTSLNSRLFVGGDSSFNSNVYVGKDLLINGNLNVKQYTTNLTVYTVSYEFIVAEDMSLNGRLFLYQDASMNKRLFVGGDISTNGNLFVLSDASLSSRLFVASDVSLNKRLFVGGDISTNGNLFALSDASLSSRLFVASDVSLNKRLFVGGDISTNGNLFVLSDASLSSRLFVGSDVSLNKRLFVGGYVGINTSTPTNMLQIMCNTSTSQSTAPDGGSNHGLLFTSPKSGTSVYSMAIGVDNSYGIGYINAAGNSIYQPVVLQSRGGNVGIGITSPAYALDIQDNVAASNKPFLNLANPIGGTTAGINITPWSGRSGGTSTQIKATDDSNYSAHLSFLTAPTGAQTTTLTERMRITSSGNIGIGTTNPLYPLDVTGSERITGGLYVTGSLSDNLPTSTNVYYNNNASSSWTLNAASFGGSTTWSIYASSRIAASEFWLKSDQRIKTNIKDIDDDIALQELRKLQPKTFNYIDNAMNETRPVYGFIAQDIENAIPYSVNYSTNTIPNIFEMADLSNGNIVTLRTKDTSLFNANENGFDLSGNPVKLEVYDEKNTKYNTTIVRIIDNKSFEIKDNFTDATLFIYGQETNDFRHIQKDAIYTITTAALQQIDREYQVTKQEVADLKTTIQTQQAQIDALMARLTALENK